VCVCVCVCVFVCVCVLIYGSLKPDDAAPLQNRLTIGSSVSAQRTRVPNTRTTERVTCVAIGRIYATHAMRSNT